MEDIRKAELMMAVAACNAVRDYYEENGELDVDDDSSLPYQIALAAHETLKEDPETLNLLDTVDQGFIRFRAIASFVQDAIRQFEPED